MAGSGRLGRATRKWAAELDPPVWALVLVELAKDAADMADRNRGKDDRLYLAAATRLQQLIGSVDRAMFLRSVGREHGAGAEADGVGDDDWSRELAGLMGSGPTVGDAA